MARRAAGVVAYAVEVLELRAELPGDGVGQRAGDVFGVAVGTLNVGEAVTVAGVKVYCRGRGKHAPARREGVVDAYISSPRSGEGAAAVVARGDRKVKFIADKVLIIRGYAASTHCLEVEVAGSGRCHSAEFHAPAGHVEVAPGAEVAVVEVAQYGRETEVAAEGVVILYVGCSNACFRSSENSVSAISKLVVM